MNGGAAGNRLPRETIYLGESDINLMSSIGIGMFDGRDTRHPGWFFAKAGHCSCTTRYVRFTSEIRSPRNFTGCKCEKVTLNVNGIHMLH